MTVPNFLLITVVWVLPVWVKVLYLYDNTYYRQTNYTIGISVKNDLRQDIKPLCPPHSCP